MAITVTILEGIFGLDSPVIDDAGRSKFYWRWLGLLPKSQRKRIVDNLRLKQVNDTIRRYSLDILITATPLAGFRHYMQRIIYRDKEIVTEENAPVMVRLMLQELGPTYVKLGQMIASRSEMLPPEWESELNKLQSEVAPFPYEEAERIINAELGGSPEEVFATFAEQPFAAASMAQVYRATLLGGEDAVVKVQRPDIDVTVRGDLNVMRDVVSTLEKRAKWARNLGLSGMVDEFAENVTEELDYQIEAYNARRLKTMLSDFDYVRIPNIYGTYCTSKVITMEFMQGVKMTQVDAMDAAGIDRQELARKLIRVMNKQVLLDGFFHGDPHPGNVLVDLDTGQIIFLDLGMMGQMTDEQRMALFDIIWSLKYGESRDLTNILLRLSTRYKEFDEEDLNRDIDRLVQRHVVYAESTPELSVIVQEALNLLYKYGLQLDRSLMQGVILDQIQSDTVYEGIKKQGIRTAKNLIVNWPKWQRAAGRWAEQLESGNFSIQLNTEQLNKNIDRVNQSLNQSVRSIIVGLLLIGMLIGSAIISLAPLQNLRFLDFLPYDVFIIIFIIAVLLALGYVVYSLWSSWRRKDE
jgi:ubiquinone biosynthesis protein